MRLLLDTHTLLWAAHEPEKLSRRAADALCDPSNTIFVSAVSAVEIVTKARQGKLQYMTDLAFSFVPAATAQGYALLSISCEHAERAAGYASHNQDPWHRLLAAQAQIDRLTLVSCDEKMPEFGAELLW